MDLVRNLPRVDRARFEIIVWTFQSSGELAPMLQKAGIEVIPPHRPNPGLVNGGRRQKLGRMVRAGISLGSLVAAGIQVIRRRRIDVLHAILPNGYMVAALASLLCGGRPLVMSRLSQNWYHQDLPLLGVIERRLLHPLTTIAIGNAEAILSELHAEGIPRRKLRLVRNGIDIASFNSTAVRRREVREELAIATASFVITSVANLHRYKGHADLLAALHGIREQLGSGWRLLVVGEDRHGTLGQLRQLATKLELAENVQFLGGRGDVSALLTASDLHVSASHSEGLPNNILEAMSASLPVVATAVGGVPELVVHQTTGLLVPAHDPRQLGAAIAQLADDTDRRHAMGQAGLLRAREEFSIERSVASLEEIYEQAFTPRRRRQRSTEGAA